MTDINELMEKDPLHLTKPDIAELITYIRQGRAQYNLGAKDPVSKSARAKPAAVVAPKIKLDLSTLLKKKV